MSAADTLAIVMALAVQPGPNRYAEMGLPPAAPQVTIENQRGGSVSGHASRVIEYDRENSSVRVTGFCVSACTLVLALPPDRICVTPQASFGFHQPTLGYDPKNTTTDLGTAMEEAYPRFVQQWLNSNFHGLPTGAPKYMRYDLLKAHYRTCT